MGNVNCAPSDCINMRPGQAASECFRQASDTKSNKFKVSSGTPQELLEEWTNILKQMADAFSEDPESNLYVLRISKPLLTTIFDTKLKVQSS